MNNENPISLEEVIRRANKVILSWSLLPLNKKYIYNVEGEKARGILLHFIKRWIITDPIDFKRLSRSIKHVVIDQETKSIIGVQVLDPGDQYFRNKFRVMEVISKLKSIDYISLVDSSTSLTVTSDIEDFNFDSITNIKF